MGETSWRLGTKQRCRAVVLAAKERKTAEEIAALQFLPAIGSPELIYSSCYLEAAMTEKAAPPRQVWHEKSEAMRHNNGPDGKRPQKIEAK